ncbi:hypothetical protein CHU98_g2033 [Xylaria longipes]|nr:hypothetical protein CHU98_g2033 [Xylaria longipes]
MSFHACCARGLYGYDVEEYPFENSLQPGTAPIPIAWKDRSSRDSSRDSSRNMRMRSTAGSLELSQDMANRYDLLMLIVKTPSD